MSNKEQFLINFDKYSHKLSLVSSISYESAYLDMKKKLKKFTGDKRKKLFKLKNPSREIYKHCKKNYI